MGPEYMGIVDIKGIVHRPGGMMGRYIECLEVMVVVLYLRPLNHLKAHSGEEVFHPFNSFSDGMQTTEIDCPARQGDVDPLGFQSGVKRSRLQCCPLAIQPVGKLLFRRIDQGTRLGSLISSQPPQGFQESGERAFLAQIIDPQLLQLSGRLGPVNGLDRSAFKCL